MSINKGIDGLARVFKAVRELCESNLMRSFTALPIVFIYPELWLGKDEKYVEQWCKNVLRVWAIKYPKEYKKSKGKTLLIVKHQEDGRDLCTYGESDGLVLLG